MSIAITSEASLDLVTLQKIIAQKESSAPYRLRVLLGKEEEGHPYNAHDYVRVADGKAPQSRLFDVGSDGNAEDDPVVKTWLDQHPGQSVVCANEVYISDSLERIAVVR
jgi:hypothetical protein